MSAQFAHDLVEFTPRPTRMSDVRMVYCRFCGATQTIEPSDTVRPPLAECQLTIGRLDLVYAAPTAAEVPEDAG